MPVCRGISLAFAVLNWGKRKKEIGGEWPRKRPSEASEERQGVAAADELVRRRKEWRGTMLERPQVGLGR